MSFGKPTMHLRWIERKMYNTFEEYDKVLQQFWEHENGIDYVDVGDHPIYGTWRDVPEAGVEA